MIERLNEWVNEICNADAKFSYSRVGDLSTSAFLQYNTAQLMAERINVASHPFVDKAFESNGWLILTLSDALYSHLLAVCAPIPDLDNLLENRLNTWLRHGDRPCPKDAVVRRTLLKTVLGLSTPAEILSMTHHKDGMERIELEHELGGVARAMLYSIKGGIE
ncbi:MAG: hypothetical protein PHT58_06575 [Eubacteriales bacterium]|nr:hypothetical protein [Eubacteriales bacterium]